MKLHLISLFLLCILFSAFVRADQTNKILPKSETIQNYDSRSLETHQTIAVLPTDEQMSQYFSEDDCNEILARVAGHDFQKIAPRTLAIVASCEPPGKDSEKMFQFAERKDPENDTILLLHARYRSKKLAVNADDLWIKLKLKTQNETLKELADQYLQGTALRKTNPLELRPSSLYFTGSAGLINESNPRALANSDPTANNSSSPGVTATGAARVSLDSAVGTVNLDYILSSTTYFNFSDVNLLTQDIDVPVVFQSTRELSFAFRPFGSYYFLGGLQFYDRAGGAFMYIFENENFSHTIQAQVYQDGYFFTNFSALGGTHYRGEYTVKLFSETFFNPQVTVLVDHVNASQDSSATQNIFYSHTDSGVMLAVNHVFGNFTFGLNPQLYVRDDDQDSRYLNAATGAAVSKRRQDFQTVVRAFVSCPVSKTFELIGSYEWNTIRSNMGVTDYLDRNSFDQTFGIQLKAGFNNVY